jgi:hypothetical protein
VITLFGRTFEKWQSHGYSFSIILELFASVNFAHFLHNPHVPSSLPANLHCPQNNKKLSGPTPAEID